jgi:CheY-like chemotaxis protein
MGLRLLILDDNPAFGEFVRILAQRLGWSAEQTLAAGEFHARLRDLPPDVVSLDLDLGAGAGRSDGADELRFLQQAGYRNPVILMSGYDGPEIEAAEQLGAALGLAIAATVKKPARAAEVRAALDSAAELIRRR